MWWMFGNKVHTREMWWMFGNKVHTTEEDDWEKCERCRN